MLLRAAFVLPRSGQVIWTHPAREILHCSTT